MSSSGSEGRARCMNFGGSVVLGKVIDDVDALYGQLFAQKDAIAALNRTFIRDFDSKKRSQDVKVLTSLTSLTSSKNDEMHLELESISRVWPSLEQLNEMQEKMKNFEADLMMKMDYLKGMEDKLIAKHHDLISRLKENKKEVQNDLMKTLEELKSKKSRPEMLVDVTAEEGEEDGEVSIAGGDDEKEDIQEENVSKPIEPKPIDVEQFQGEAGEEETGEDEETPI